MPVIRLDNQAVHLLSSVGKLYENSELTDCVLDTKGGFIRAHKTVLAACCPYIKKLLMDHGEMRIFSFKEVEHQIMKLILNIVYYGEVEVPPSRITLFFQTAKLMQITSLVCDSSNISESFFLSNTAEFCSDNCTTSWGINHSRNDERIPPFIQNGANNNPSLCHARENRSNSASGNKSERSILSSETEVSNIFDEVSVRIKMDHPMTVISNSEEVVLDRESSDGVSLQEELRPIIFVAVPSGLVKSEKVDDEENLSCIGDVELRNPLPGLPHNNDMINEVTGELDQKYSTDTKVNVQNEEVISERKKMNGPSRTISSAMNQSLNELSTSFVDDVLTDTKPTSSSLIGRQQEMNRDSDNTWISKYKLKKVRVVLTRIKPLHSTLDLENVQSPSWSSMQKTPNSERGGEESFHFACEQNINQREDNSSGNKLNLKDAGVNLTSMNNVTEEDKDSNHSGCNQNHCLSVTREEKKSAHKEKLSNKIDKGTSAFKYAVKSKRHFSCDICQKSFNRKSNLTIHKRLHRGDKPYSCDVCKSCFVLKSHLKVHKRIHTGEKPHSCVICEASFRRFTHLIRHRRTHSTEKPYSCDVCQASFKRKDHKERHMRIHTGVRPFSCDICEKSFNRKSHHIDHMRNHSGDKPYSCDVCKTCFVLKSRLKVHMRIHSGDKPFSCDVCHKCFSDKSVLKSHERVHTGERPFTCDICQKSFNWKSNLTIHKRFHIGGKPFKCDECRASFYQRGELNRHIKIHSGMKSFSCNICQKSFSRKSNLSDHMRIHTGEKPFSCDVCKKCFSNKSGFNRHKRMHTGERPFSCDICQKCFTRESTLRNHIRIHSISHI